MSTDRGVARDERTGAVENAGHKWALTFVVFALVIDVMYRAWFRHEAAWDLMALAVAGGAIVQVYKARQKALSRGWVKAGLFPACVAAVVGVITVAVFFALAKYDIVDLTGLP